MFDLPDEMDEEPIQIVNSGARDRHGVALFDSGAWPNKAILKLGAGPLSTDRATPNSG